jgi:uncharacterized protein (TIGR00255 family)
MTGFGEARMQGERLSASVEVRTVNNRHLKMSARLSEPYGSLEPEVERLVREHIYRGTVQITLRVERPRRPEDYRLNLVALASYREQILRLQGTEPGRIDLAALLGLPGVVEEVRSSSEDPHDDWPLLAPVVTEALSALRASRAEEGRSMAEELLALGRAISVHLERIHARGPQVVSGYQERLTARVQALIESHGVTLEPKDVIREVAIFSERSDIAEEVTRLRAHLDQYHEVIGSRESAGRKLEFVVQEMGRETNTMGSKAGDVEISREVVEIKGLLERIRELIQNVE